MLILKFIMFCFISDLIILVVYSLIKVNQEGYLFKGKLGKDDEAKT